METRTLAVHVSQVARAITFYVALMTIAIILTVAGVPFYFTLIAPVGLGVYALFVKVG